MHKWPPVLGRDAVRAFTELKGKVSIGVEIPEVFGAECVSSQKLVDLTCCAGRGKATAWV